MKKVNRFLLSALIIAISFLIVNCSDGNSVKDEAPVITSIAADLGVQEGTYRCTIYNVSPEEASSVGISGVIEEKEVCGAIVLAMEITSHQYGLLSTGIAGAAGAPLLNQKDKIIGVLSMVCWEQRDDGEAHYFATFSKL